MFQLVGGAGDHRAGRGIGAATGRDPGVVGGSHRQGDRVVQVLRRFVSPLDGEPCVRRVAEVEHRFSSGDQDGDDRIDPLPPGIG
ncbi:MAG TPA: hypothetical protein VGP31_09505 [Planosporangium sp.]|nr:hypothetical protein [Planosporangium sp.]